MTPKFEKLVNEYLTDSYIDDVVEEAGMDLSQQGTGGISKMAAGASPKPQPSNPISSPKPAAKPPVTAPKVATTPQQGNVDRMANLNNAITGNDYDSAAAALADITVDDPDFFDKPESEVVQKWASDPNVLKSLQTAQANRIKKMAQTASSLENDFVE